jgi:flagellin
MVNLINTNSGSSSAISHFGAAAKGLNQAQKRIASGFKVGDAYDDGAAFSMAESLRGLDDGRDAANERLAVGRGMIDVAMKAGQAISSSLQDVRSTLVKLSDSTLSAEDRANYQAQYKSLVGDIGSFIKDAGFNGVNLLKQGAADQNIAANADGKTLGVKAQNLESLIADPLAAGDVSTAAGAAALLGSNGLLKAAEDGLGSALNSLSTDAKRIDNHVNTNNAVSDATTYGLGQIVDADMSKEAAGLKAAQVREQLASQAMSIANQAPQSLLGLFG